MDVDAVFRGSEGVRQYEGEDSKQDGREDTAPLLMGKRLRLLRHCAFHVALKDCDHAQQLLWTADLF